MVCITLCQKNNFINSKELHINTTAKYTLFHLLNLFNSLIYFLLRIFANIKHFLDVIIWGIEWTLCIIIGSFNIILNRSNLFIIYLWWTGSIFLKLYHNKASIKSVNQWDLMIIKITLYEDKYY